MTRLDDAGRVTELSRMLAGLEDSEFGRAHAGELLAAAAAERAAPADGRGSAGVPAGPADRGPQVRRGPMRLCPGRVWQDGLAMMAQFLETPHDAPEQAR